MNSSSKIVFVQSYAAPKAMAADNGIYQQVCSKFPNKVFPVGFYGPIVRSLSTKEALKQAYKGIRKCKKNDLLFLWGGDLPIFSFFLTSMMGRKRMILGQNLILHKKLVEERWTQRFRYYIYKRAFRTDRFYMTVNSEPLVDYYADWFGCSKDKFFVVNDSMELNDTDKKILSERGKRDDFYVFCGGKEMRDIDGFFKVVEMMPDIKFKAVFRQSDLASTPRLPNLELFHDTTREEFYRIMAGASVCCLPLKSTSPCGLSVAQKAMLMRINIVSTDTPSMRTLIPNDEYGYLVPMYDYKGIVESIKKIHDDASIRNSQREQSLEHMKMFSSDNIAKQLITAIDYCYKKIKE